MTFLIDSCNAPAASITFFNFERTVVRTIQIDGQPPKNVTDPLYGVVKAWTTDAWAAIQGVDLAALFGEAAA